MSSAAVRTKFETFFTSELPTEKIAVMDGGYSDLSDFLAAQTPAISPSEPWVGLQYIPNIETPVTASATNSSGMYRETGLIFIHIVEIARLAVAGPIVTRAEAIRQKLRGQNINGLRVLSVSPPNFAKGATLDFEGGGYISATCVLEYQIDINI